MPILAEDIKFMRSGVDNLGGEISATTVSTEIHDLFDVVSGQESHDGDIEYRCVYLKNQHETLTLYNTKIYIEQNTLSESTTCDIGLGISSIGGTEQTIENEGIEPSGVIFSAPTAAAEGLFVGDLAPGEYQAVWIRRTVSAGAVAFNSDCVWIAFYGDTGA